MIFFNKIFIVFITFLMISCLKGGGVFELSPLFGVKEVLSLKWDTYLDTSQASFFQMGDLITDKNGDIFITAFVQGKITIDNHSISSLIGDKASFLLIKINGDGKFLWSHIFQQSFYTYPNPKIEVDFENNLIIAGEFSGSIFIFKLNPSGTMILEKNIQNNASINLKSINFSKMDNTLYIAGDFNGEIIKACDNSKTLKTDSDKRNIFILKFFKDETYCTQMFDFYENQRLLDIKITKNLDIYLTGEFTKENEPAIDCSLSQKELFFMKLNKNMELLFNKTLNGYCKNGFEQITIDSNENIYLSGSFTKTIIFPDISYSNNDNSDGFVIVFDKNGDYKSSFHVLGNNDDEISHVSIIEHEDYGNTIFIGGSSFSNIVSYDYSDKWINENFNTWFVGGEIVTSHAYLIRYGQNIKTGLWGIDKYKLLY